MPSPQTKIDVTNLERRLTELQKNLDFVGQSNNSETSELYKIIHNPGWTTIAQVELAGSILDSMKQQAVAMRGMRNALDAHVKDSAGRG